ncbi:uncharacterized protein ANIA_02252 [Aspergillus nidulans FGSC A4]|uniref:Ribonucleases P/MRP subunit Pop8-like domain-containing protein n=1 Tax=Emericella nidulans (strain FGSC A4 / ATCC 38163 / CBS 112.46 / NRRL 194 / M139) TaxID=227321 RepID=C8VMU8_EMENI|nr:hypothetical protein [Aspergillus nidulans FGSC A4]CBF86469.1 TPA: conserved hypothetical protein [Aspergillus nidulans FGSC A4]
MASTKRKIPEDSSASIETINFTARNPPWTYLKLQLIHQPNTSAATKSAPLDPLTARTHLSSALSQFLGLSGSSIPVDILSVSPDPESKFIWVRVPRQDAPAVVAAVSSWIGGVGEEENGGSVAWRVCAKGNFLSALVNGDGGDLFKV